MNTKTKELYEYLKGNIDEYSICRLSNHAISMNIEVNIRKLQAMLVELEHNGLIERFNGYERLIKVIK